MKSNMRTNNIINNDIINDSNGRSDLSSLLLLALQPLIEREEVLFA
jgi:hypothetical protein